MKIITKEDWNCQRDNFQEILKNWFNDYSEGKYIQVNGNKKHESEDIV